VPAGGAAPAAALSWSAGTRPWAAPAPPAGLPPEALQERALNEAAAFAIRIDVAEELTRLNSHLDEIERLLQAGGELGKRLDFLIQELQREANTLGSQVRRAGADQSVGGDEGADRADAGAGAEHRVRFHGVS
jgi:hypothetical protein